MRFAAMAKSGAFKPGKKKRKNPKDKVASAKKRAAKKAARKSRANPKKARRNAAPMKSKVQHRKAHRKAHRRNDAAALTPAQKAALTRKKNAEARAAAAAPKESAEETASFMAEARAGERAAKKAAMTPSERAKKAAAKRQRKARAAAKKKNAKKLGEIKSVLSSTRAELKATKGPRLKKGEKKAGKRRARRAILKARKSALNLKRSALIGSIPAADRKLLEASGLMNVRPNPGFGDVFKDFAALAPQIGAHAVALAGVAVAGQKIGDRLCKMVVGEKVGEEKTKAEASFVCKHAVTIGSVATAFAAYEAVKHISPKTRPFAGAVLLGGLAAAFVHAAARMGTKIDPVTKLPTSNLGKDLGLPLMSAAPSASIAGFIDVDGQRLAINGMGEYMALSGSTLTGSSLGEYMALSGSTLTGSSLGEFGDYMALSGSTLTGSTLGEIGQMSEGRQGDRALNSPGDPTIEDFMHDHDEHDEGSLSGSIFDD
jgi:hypothetical protein